MWEIGNGRLEMGDWKGKLEMRESVGDVWGDSGGVVWESGVGLIECRFCTHIPLVFQKFSVGTSHTFSLFPIAANFMLCVAQERDVAILVRCPPRWRLKAE